MTTHRGTTTTWADTLDGALLRARAEIRDYLGDHRQWQCATTSRPVARYVDGSVAGGWEVDVEWWVVDPVPPVPPNTGKTIGGRQ